MKKSNFISMIDNKAVLTQPLYYNEDIYRLKHETKRTILEIREAVGHCILGFSSGTDSIFIYCCIRELIEEGKLTKDAIDIVFFNVDFSNFTFSEVISLSQIPFSKYVYMIDLKNFVKIFFIIKICNQNRKTV